MAFQILPPAYLAPHAITANRRGPVVDGNLQVSETT